MITALFMRCGWLCSAELSHGAALVPPGGAFVHAGGGLHALLPAARLGAVTGLAPGMDLGAHYDTVGLVHAFGLTARVGLARAVALSVTASHALFAVEELGGLPFAGAWAGSGTSVGVALRLSTFTRSDVHVAFGLGVSVRVLALRTTELGLQRVGVFEPHHAFGEVTAEWRRHRGSVFLTFRAEVPLRPEVQLLGYLPTLLAGRTWSL
ncbi:MAG: hypothetical protein HY909_28765 [Deltaproteobacteria bacterium]|nr:hypothetical protein [Deltaproteobacteria bacterium]